MGRSKCIPYLLLLCVVGVVVAEQYGGSFSCHPKHQNWKKTGGQTVKVSVKIDGKKFPSKCTTGSDGTVTFTNNPGGLLLKKGSSLCKTKDIRKECNFVPGTLGCGCTKKTSSSYFVEYNFKLSPGVDDVIIPVISCFGTYWNKELLLYGKDCSPKLSVSLVKEPLKIGKSTSKGSKTIPSLWIVTSAAAVGLMMLPQTIIGN